MTRSSPASTSPPATPTPWLRVAAVGLLAGFTSGLFGVGGGTVIVPGLALLAGFPYKLATGTSLTAIVPIALAGIASYATGGEVDWPAALCVTAGALAGAVLGTRLLVRLRTAWLQMAFAALLLVAAVRLFAGEAEASGRPALTAAAVAALVLLGLAAGVIAGLLGVGGGVIIVPALTVLLGVPHVLAKGTSLAVIVPTAVMATVRNRRSGLTAVRPALAVGVGGVVSAWIAGQVALSLDPTVARALFGAFLAAVAVRLGRAGWRTRRLGEVSAAGS